MRWHMYMYAEEGGSGFGTGFDVGHLDWRNAAYAEANPWSTVDARINIDPNTRRLTLPGKNMKITSLTRGQYVVWLLSVLALPNNTCELPRAVPLRYSKYLGWNCTTWVLWGSAKAIGISFLSFL